MKCIKTIWSDEAGFVVSAELVVIATVLVLGMVVGLTTIRDQVLQELADVADATSEVDQSYSYTGLQGHAVSTAGTVFGDAADFCEIAGGGSDQNPGAAPQCLALNIDPETDGGGEVNIIP